MKPANAIFDDRELAFIKDNIGAMPQRQLHAEFVARFGRDDITLRQVHNCCGVRKWRRREPKIPSGSFISDGSLMLSTGNSREFRQAQRIMWESVIGPIPPDHILMPLNGDMFDLDPLNWIMLTRAMANRLRQSPFFDATPELRPSIFALARLKQALQDQTGKRHDFRKGRKRRDMRRNRKRNRLKQ